MISRFLFFGFLYNFFWDFLVKVFECLGEFLLNFSLSNAALRGSQVWEEEEKKRKVFTNSVAAPSFFLS